MRTTRRLGSFALVTSLLTTAMLLGMAEVAARVVLNRRYGSNATFRTPGTDARALLQYDALLGWKRVPGRTLPGDTSRMTINAQGFRAPYEYTIDVPEGRHRIVCVGDSFTQGVGSDSETYPAQLEALSPAIEAVNMGRGGYGLDQMYLFYKRDGAALRTNLLLFAFIEDDFVRMRSNTFRMIRPKPQLVVQQGELIVANTPVPRSDQFPRNTGLFKILQRTGERLFTRYELYPVVERVFDDLKSLSRERDQQLVLVYLPTVMDSPGLDRPTRDIARRVEEIARNRQITFWNLTSMFRGVAKDEVPTYFLPDGHYSARGNQLAATTLLSRLRQQFPDVP